MKNSLDGQTPHAFMIHWQRQVPRLKRPQRLIKH
jgi:hypothetical protein